jgi:hypothetical protein
VSNHANEYSRNPWAALRRLRTEDAVETWGPAVPMAWHVADAAAVYIEAGGHPMCRPGPGEVGFMLQGCDSRPVIWVTTSPECFAWECQRRGVYVLGWVHRGVWDVQAPNDAAVLRNESGPP